MFIAFEHHVFQEMSHAVLLALLNGTASATPELKTGNGRIGTGSGVKGRPLLSAVVCGMDSQALRADQRIKADLLTMAILPWVCAL